MRHQVDGRKFGRNTSHRVAMFRVMANNLIHHKGITTTVEKAKEVRRVVDRLITLAKKGSLHSKRLAFDRTRDREVVVKLFSTLAERYSKRPGGYTRIMRMDATRRGDAAEMAHIELVDRPVVEKKKKKAAKDDHAHDHDHAHEDGEKVAKKAAGKAPVVAKGAGKSKVSGSTGKKSTGPKSMVRTSGGGRSSSSS